MCRRRDPSAANHREDQSKHDRYVKHLKKTSTGNATGDEVIAVA